jgi:hypothetical protein
MKQPSRKTIFVVVALSLLGVAGTAAAASLVAPATHSSDHGAGSLLEFLGFKVPPATAPTPTDSPHHHGGCGWHHSGDGW